MRFLLLSDIHSNLIALESVLNHAKAKRWDELVFLGDAVGYYTQANEVLERLRELKPIINILGNHDALLLKCAESPQHFALREDSLVAEVIVRQEAELTAENKAYIDSFTDYELREGWELAHGGLRSQWEYIVTLQNAQANAPFMKTDLCFIGHTHVPGVYASVVTARGEMWRSLPFRQAQSTYRLPPKAKVFFNPGSVGQARDGIPLASYAIFDEGTRVIEHYRVEYDILGVQRLVREKNYPEVLAKRLVVGK